MAPHVRKFVGQIIIAQHELFRRRRIGERAICCITIHLKLRSCRSWLPLALVLCRLPFLGLPNSRCLMELLVEGPGIVNVNITP